MNTKIIIILFVLFSLNSLLAQTERENVQNLFDYSNSITAITNDLVSLSIDAAWLASELTGTTTLTGTITQNQTNPNNWNYSSSPSDKLIVIFADGSSVEFVYASIDGYVGGTVDDFKESHSMSFSAFINDYLNLQIISTATPNSEKTDFSKTISGTIIFNNEVNTLNITHIADVSFEIGNGFAFGKYNDLVTGTSSTPTKSYTLNDKYFISISHNSNDAIYVKSSQRWSGSSIAVANTTYAFSGLDVFWIGGTNFEGYYNNVIEDYNWGVSGNLLKNSENFGAIKFSSDVVNYTNGPLLIATLTNENIILSYLLNPLPTSVEVINNIVVNDFSLYQNYPNPFNPSTTINYSVSKSGLVSLKIYNLKGEVVKVLVNKNQVVGTYSVHFDGTNLASGTYIYELQSEGNRIAKKMLLIK